MNVKHVFFQRLWLKFAMHNTLRNRRRSLVTVSIAALGTAAILLAGGFALYTYEALAQAAARDTGHLVLGKPRQFTADEDTPCRTAWTTWRPAHPTAGRPGRAPGAAQVEFSGLISNGDKSTVMMAAGVEPDSEFAVKGPFLTVTSGRCWHPAARAEVMLGEAWPSSLKATPGSSLTLLASTTEGRHERHGRGGQGHLHHRRARDGQARWSTPTWPWPSACW
jgi:putative ABC transport system permease protein